MTTISARAKLLWSELESTVGTGTGGEISQGDVGTDTSIGNGRRGARMAFGWTRSPATEAGGRGQHGGVGNGRGGRGESPGGRMGRARGSGCGHDAGAGGSPYRFYTARRAPLRRRKKGRPRGPRRSPGRIFCGARCPACRWRVSAQVGKAGRGVASGLGGSRQAQSPSPRRAGENDARGDLRQAGF